MKTYTGMTRNNWTKKLFDKNMTILSTVHWLFSLIVDPHFTAVQEAY